MSAGTYVVAAGALTPVGLTTAQTCTALRAGISAFAESEFLLFGTEREPIVVASVPLRPRPSASKPAGRLTAMSRIALRECLRDGGLEPAKTALLLGVADRDRIARSNDWFEEDLLARLRSSVLRHFHGASELLPYGNTAVFAGLAKARELLQSREVAACIVGGVDSLLNAPDLEEIRRTWRLHRDGEGNGMIPGEAAAFVAVSHAERTPTRAPLADIVGLGLDREANETTVLSEGQPTGRGLLRALRKAISDADLPESAVGFRVTDLNGERYGAMDSLLAMSRFYRTDRDGMELWHPAESIGETGAAVGAVLLQMVCHAFQRGYAPFSTAMCETASDSGYRAACVVRAVPA